MAAESFDPVGDIPRGVIVALCYSLRADAHGVGKEGGWFIAWFEFPARDRASGERAEFQGLSGG